MRKYLIFRTDRIGDYVFSRIITQSILDSNKKNQIDIICSKYNSGYIKKYKDINKIYILDKWDFINLFNTAIKINRVNYDYLTKRPIRKEDEIWLKEQIEEYLAQTQSLTAKNFLKDFKNFIISSSDQSVGFFNFSDIEFNSATISGLRYFRLLEVADITQEFYLKVE